MWRLHNGLIAALSQRAPRGKRVIHRRGADSEIVERHSRERNIRSSARSRTRRRARTTGRSSVPELPHLKHSEGQARRCHRLRGRFSQRRGRERRSARRCVGERAGTCRSKIGSQRGRIAGPRARSASARRWWAPLANCGEGEDDRFANRYWKVVWQLTQALGFRARSGAERAVHGVFRRESFQAGRSGSRTPAVVRRTPKRAITWHRRSCMWTCTASPSATRTKSSLLGKIMRFMGIRYTSIYGRGPGFGRVLKTMCTPQSCRSSTTEDRGDADARLQAESTV